MSFETKVKIISSRHIDVASVKLEEFLNSIDISKVAQMLHTCDRSFEHIYTIIYVVERHNSTSSNNNDTII